MGHKALLKEAAQAVDLSRNALYKLARAKKVPFLRVGNRYIFDIELLEQSLREMALQNVRQPEPPEYGKIRAIR
ncbi:MAG: hypothetical protein PWR06_2347 [Thermoanaerobacteraceae bacterium]|nr:hypothetical protein [Thermoanaerobacteraceae bacterium]